MTPSTSTFTPIIEKTRQYLNDEDLWPSWPFFCVKRLSDGELGFISADNRLRVWVGNFYEFVMTKRYPSTRFTYNSVEELLQDGWIGD